MGRCAGSSCASIPHVWVLAACEGMISLFDKHADGTLALLLQEGGAVAPSVDHARASIDEALRKGTCTQLVLIGSSKDMAWVQTLLPEHVSHHIVAEIAYPLMSAWFRQSPAMTHMIEALQQVFQA